MKKFAVFSGFLGAGKTTAMIALTKYYTENFAPAAMISNDLGHGVTLADHRLARLSGANASEITGDCICYVNELLADRLDDDYAQGCELVVSDIPGFGVGALEHVYHGLAEKWPGRFALAPFTVLVEPRTVELLRAGSGGDLLYIYDAQLAEAEPQLAAARAQLDAGKAQLDAGYAELNKAGDLAYTSLAESLRDAERPQPEPEEEEEP